MITSTIEWIEVVWTLCALPGLILWVLNKYEALLDWRAVRNAKRKQPQARILWAQFSARLCLAFIAVESVFVLLGVLGFLRPAPPGDPILRVISSSALITVGLLITYMGYRWRAVNRDILTLARQHQGSAAQRQTLRKPEDTT